jgi:hypothetical protein
VIDRFIVVENTQVVSMLSPPGQEPVLLHIMKDFTAQGQPYVKEITVHGPLVLEGQAVPQFAPITINHISEAAKALHHVLVSRSHD